MSGIQTEMSDKWHCCFVFGWHCLPADFACGKRREKVEAKIKEKLDRTAVRGVSLTDILLLTPVVCWLKADQS